MFWQSAELPASKITTDGDGWNAPVMDEVQETYQGAAGAEFQSDVYSRIAVMVQVSRIDCFFLLKWTFKILYELKLQPAKK